MDVDFKCPRYRVMANAQDGPTLVSIFFIYLSGPIVTTESLFELDTNIITSLIDRKIVRFMLKHLCYKVIK